MTLSKSSTGATRRLLHVGCGVHNPMRLPAGLRGAGWQEIRLDIDPGVQPDIIGTITDMAAVADAGMDGLYSSHNLEHLNSYEVPQALAEFRRVLKPTGFALITVPDLRAVARHVAHDHLTETLYESKAGPINALDILFGHQAALQRGNHYMAHRTGFTARTLGQCLIDAGFAEVRVHEGRHLDLWAIAAMPETDPAVYQELAAVAQ